MFCPTCGQRQISEDTSFCSKCGFLLTGVTELIYNGGALPQAIQRQQSKPTKDSPRKRGIKQGLFIFLLSFLVVPLIAILTIAIDAREPFMVAIAAISLTVGGLLRMAYALMFESTEPYPGAMTLEENALNAAQNFLGRNKSAAALPPQQSIPTSTYVPPTAGNWRDTNDLNATPSVTENTTKFLDEKR